MSECVCMCVCVVLCAWRTRLLHLGAAADYFPSLGWWRRGARAVHPLGAAGLASNKTNKGHPVVTNLGDTAADPDIAIRSSGVRGLAPPNLFCLLSCELVNGCPMYNYILGTFVYFCGLSISMFGLLGYFCTVCWYFSLESSVCRSTMSLL